jgi:hypothetical protein
MSTNVADPRELTKLYARTGVRPASDGAGFVISARRPSAGYEPAAAVVGLRGRAVVARQPHKLEVAGSIPAPATNLVGHRQLKEAGPRIAGSNLGARGAAHLTGVHTRGAGASPSASSARKVQYPSPTTISADGSPSSSWEGAS